MRYQYGMVSAPQRAAVEAGLESLKAGGNVVDAAVCAALVQTVVDPMACGIAGFGSMHLYLADQGVHKVLDFHGRAPASVTPQMWEDLVLRECDDGFGFVLKGEVNEIGYQSATTPMTLRAMEDALALYGTKSLSEVLAPAVAQADQGFLVTPSIHAFWNRPAAYGRIARLRGITDNPEAARIYSNGHGASHKVGDIVRNPDMARTLRRIQNHGVADFYCGDIASEIVADMDANGGLLTAQDLAGATTELNDPLWTQYRGYEIASNPPPGGGLMLLQMLNILAHFDLSSMGHNSPDYVATVSEAMKIATIDKDTRTGDPAFADVPVADILSPDYAAHCAARIKAGEKADVARVNPGGLPSTDTTHICVADPAGNCVSLTHSLGSSSGVVTPGLGFMYSNGMAVFDPRPGRIGSLAPGKARVTAMSPTIGFHGGKPSFLVGAPGGTTITMGNLQAILNIVDFGMSAQEAVDAPRFITTSNTIEICDRIFVATERRLKERGYAVKRHPQSYLPPRVHVVRFTASGLSDGGADPGGGGVALGI